MNRIKSLTKAEEDIMQLIWMLDRCTVSNILDELPAPRPPHSSISSIVRILERKGFVDHKAYGRTYEYFPVITKADYSKRSLLSLLKDYFDGSTPRLVSYLVEEDQTSIEELQELIKQLKKKSA
ncbi:MAG: BlaI/MecI/CopY family transcriptional regulator [Bacteroidota bacterium]|nr:BlaI/MecI/CopY family transcriptional regulator [Bacteroidota bacterium]